jgi:hypothetical protein
MLPERHTSSLTRREFLAAGGAVVGGLGNIDGAAVHAADFRVVWDLDKAHRETTATRERACLNGLWQWQPAREVSDVVPDDRWGHYKVPAFWPGRSNYIQEDCQTLYPHSDWKDADARATNLAWYQREIAIPAAWADRRIAVRAEYVNSFAVVYLDGKKVGEIRYPAGEVDVTAACRPGAKQVLSLLVMALPLKGVLLSYADTNSAREVRGSVERRGLCGDVWLVSTPRAARVTHIKIDTSVRRAEITVDAAIEGLANDRQYTVRVEISKAGRTVRAFSGQSFRAGDLAGGRISVTEAWKPDALWDVHTPQNTFDAHVSLIEGDGTLRDAYHTVRFGFREFWIDGKDFFLNGTRLFLSAVPLDNAQIGARTATYEAVRETLQRLRSFGINFVYTHNYGCEPGSHVSFADVLRAADDEGMLVAFSQPHFGHYDWKAPDADKTNGYARHAEFYVREAQNHPSVVAYSMSHNATGYDEDMNPDQIDGRRDPRSDGWSRNNSNLALRAEAIVRALDPGRIVYHHSSGNLGSMHTMNFYLNFVPIQEVSDWFEHWSRDGVKPVFPCEYGVPFTWDWAMYRGWYKGERSFGSARVPWEFCLAEWNAQFVGDAAYKISDAEKQNLRWEAGQFRAGRLWQRWDYPHHLGSNDFDERQAIFARYITDNWRAHRTWGISANSPWEYATFWKPRGGVSGRRKELAVDWENLQKPGFSPDYVVPRRGWMSVDGERADWVPTAAAETLIRNNRPLLAYIAGKPSSVTSKDHNFRPGDIIEKQLVVINNSRKTASCQFEWSGGWPGAPRGGESISVKPGDQQRVPLRFELPAMLAPGRYEIAATVRFGDNEMQKDSFVLHVLPRPLEISPAARIALLDPNGETARALTGLRISFQTVDVAADLSPYDMLIIGKEALTSDGLGPNLGCVRDGLKVVVFEQTAGVLEKRFGFRVAEYGLREVFGRVPDHPILAGLDAEHLRDWRGDATLLSPRLRSTSRPRHGPTVKWCGIDVSRAWRCGCRGNVASVLIEKPARGDFLPMLDGGYGLQYSPLLQYREGQGMVLFCQMDVNGRSEHDPAANTLIANIVSYVSAWKPSPIRKALYAGEAAGKKHLESAGFALTSYSKGELPAHQGLIVGPGGGRQLAADAAAIKEWLAGNASVLAIGLDQEDAAAFLPFAVNIKPAEHIAAYFEPPGRNSLLAGVGPADVHNRDPRALPLVSAGANVFGDGVLASAEGGKVVFCQLVPWQFDPTKQMNLKRTFRRVSYLVARLASNLGVASSTPLLDRFRESVAASGVERRWLNGLYLDVPEEWDDPYRFFRW